MDIVGTKLCSVLIPTRARPDRLRRAVESISDTVTDPMRVEVILRVDHDDPHLDAALALSFDGTITTKVGDRRQGYASMHEFYDELAGAAAGRWIFIMNDDAFVIGKGWDEDLAKVPIDGVIVQPEIYQLGESLYPFCEGGAFPMVPNGCWHYYGWQGLRDPVDTQLDQLLRVQHGWRTAFLPGMCVVHERDPDHVLAEHRRM